MKFINKDLLLTMLFIRLQSFNKAAYYLNMFLENSSELEGKSKEYYTAVLFLLRLYKKDSIDHLKIAFESFSNEIEFEEIYQIISCPDRVFEDVNIFQCDACSLEEGACCLKNERELYSQIQKIVNSSFV